MTLQEVMAANGGFWDKEYAMIQVGQYVKCVAVGRPDAHQLTDFGKTLVAELANTSADVVVSEPKKRGRKAEPQPVVAEPEPAVDLDDLAL